MADEWKTIGPGVDEEEMMQSLGSIIDSTKEMAKIHYANDIMSSLLAKITIIVNDEDDEPLRVLIDRVRDLLEWYEMYQAGVLDANITGSAKNKGYTTSEVDGK